MPIECAQLRFAPEPFRECPKCGAEPFEHFARGMVQRRKKRWIWWGKWDYCAVICWGCKERVGWESPPMVKEQDNG